MAQRSFPFDAGSGAIITEADWSSMAANWLESGVIDLASSRDGNVLAVTANGANHLKVFPGAYWLSGFMYVNDDELDLTITTNSDPTNARIDRVVLRLDRTVNSIVAAVKEGTPAASPTAPAVAVDEVSLCTYTVPSGSATGQSFNGDTVTAGRGIRIVRATTDIPWGSIGYNLTDNKFYMRDASGTITELGAGGATDFRTVTSGTRPTDTYSGLTIYEYDTRRLLAWNNATASWNPPAGTGGTRHKTADGVSLTGATTIEDADLSFQINGSGPYRVSGEVFYSSNNNGASCTFSLFGPATSWQRGVFRHISGASTNVVHTTSSSLSSGCSISTPVSGTVYAVQFDYIMQVSSSGPAGVRTNAISAGTWQLRQGSYMRVERLGGNSA